jgi:hypothetical protein
MKIRARSDAVPVDDGDPKMLFLGEEDLPVDLEIFVIQGELEPCAE